MLSNKKNKPTDLDLRGHYHALVGSVKLKQSTVISGTYPGEPLLQQFVSSKIHRILAQGNTSTND
jgi:hypothetical protein